MTPPNLTDQLTALAERADQIAAKLDRDISTTRHKILLDRAVGVMALAALLGLLAYGFHQQRLRDQDKCDRGVAIVAGFQAYTTALVAASAAMPRPPEQQAGADERVKVFRDDIATRLAPLVEHCQ